MASLPGSDRSVPASEPKTSLNLGDSYSGREKTEFAVAAEPTETTDVVRLIRAPFETELRSVETLLFLLDFVELDDFVPLFESWSRATSSYFLFSFPRAVRDRVA